MNEKLKQLWNDHKEDIKTGTILVLAPIAFMGLMASKGLNDVAHFLSNVTDNAKEK